MADENTSTTTGGTGDPAAAAAAAAAAAQTATTTTTTTTAPWYGDNAEVAGYLQNRGLIDKTVNDVALSAIQAHREAEKFIGAPAAELVRLPKDANDADGWNKVWTRLGRPADATGYDAGEYATNEATKDRAEFLRQTFFKNGTPKSMGENLIRDIAAQEAKDAGEKLVRDQAAVQVERDALRAELGQNYDVSMAVAKRAAAALGVTPEAIAVLEKSVGYTQVMKMFMNIGSKIGEDKFITSEQTGSIVTKEAAQDRITTLKADESWVKAYLNGDSQKVKEMHDLQVIVAGGDDTDASRARSGR